MDDARRTEVKTGDRYIRAGLLFAAQIWLMVEQVKGIVTSAKGIADSYEKIAEALQGQGARVGLLRIADATEEMAATLHATQYASMRLPTGNGQRYQVINQIVTSALARSRDAYSDAATMADEGSRMQMRLRPGRTSAYGGTVFSVNMGGYRPDIEEAPMANPGDPADPENAKPFLAYHEAESEEGEGDLWEPDGGSGSTAMAAPSIGGVPRIPVASALPVPSGAPLLSPRDLKGLSQQDRATLLFAGATASPSAIALAAQVATGGVPARAAARAPLRTAEAILVAARGPARASFQERYQGNAAACPVPEDNASQDNGTILMARAAAQASAAVIAADVTVTDVQAQREKLRLAAAAEARAHRDLKLGNVRRSFGRF